MQLPEGERVVASFPPRTNLWDVLQHFERARATTFTTLENAKTGTYVQPVLSFLNREISTNRELRNTTLETLGLAPGSNGLMRLVLRQTETKFKEFLELDQQSILQEADEREKLDQMRAAKQEQQKKDQEMFQQREQEAKLRAKQAEEEEQAKRDHMRKLMAEEAAKIERQRQVKEQAEQMRQQQKAQKEEQERMWRQQKLIEAQEKQRMESERLALEIAAGSSQKSTANDAMEIVPKDDDKMDVDAAPQQQQPSSAPAAVTFASVFDQIPSEPLDRNPTAFAPSNTPFDASQSSFIPLLHLLFSRL